MEKRSRMKVRDFNQLEFVPRSGECEVFDGMEY